MTAVTTTGRASAIDKTMALYQALSSTPEALRLSDLSRRTGLAKSTTHRLLNALIAAGMATRLGVGYIAVHRPAPAAPGSERQRELLRRLAPYVCDAAIRTRFTTSLALLDGPDVRFVHRVYSHENVPTPSDFSGRARAHLTAAGLLMLAHDLRAACGSAGEWGLDAEQTARLEGELMAIRRRGYALRVGSGHICVAVPVSAYADGAPIALAAKGIGTVADAEHTARLLRSVAATATPRQPGAHLSKLRLASGPVTRAGSSDVRTVR